ncbi:hypothetical protein GCM10027294_43070 [Marinactinospora endophytica]
MRDEDAGAGAFPPWDAIDVSTTDGEALLWRNRAALLFDTLPVPVAVCSADGVVLLANLAMAAEWGTLPGRLSGRNALDLFRPRDSARMRPLLDALRLRHRARFSIDVGWRVANGSGRHGELTVDVVSQVPGARPVLLLTLRAVSASADTGVDDRAGGVSRIEARILAGAARGETTARIAEDVGMTVDGVNYHLRRLSRLWNVRTRTALVARAYVLGVLAPDAWPPVPVQEAGDRA